MIKLDYNLSFGNKLFIDHDTIHTNISSFRYLPSGYHVIVGINHKDRLCYLENHLVLDLDVAAYLNGIDVENDFKKHQIDTDTIEYLPKVNTTVLIGEAGWENRINWETKALWLCDYSTLSGRSGLSFAFYDGGLSLRSPQYWKDIK